MATAFWTSFGRRPPTGMKNPAWRSISQPPNAAISNSTPGCIRSPKERSKANHAYSLMMTSFKDLSIKSKMTAIIMLTSGITLLLACAAFVGYEMFSFRQSLVSELSTLAEITGKNCVGPMNFETPEGGESVLANLSGESQIIAACIYKDRKVWARYPPSLDVAGLPGEPAGASHRFEQNALAVFRPINDRMNHDKQIGTIYLRSDLRQMDARLRAHVATVAVLP